MTLSHLAEHAVGLFMVVMVDYQLYGGIVTHVW